MKSKTPKWLTKRPDIFDDPSYYLRLLPPYSFEGETDESLLENWLRNQTNKRNKFKVAIDLGCGTGRGTIILAKYAKKVIAVDINQRMLNFAKTVLKEYRNVELIKDEMFNFISRMVITNFIKKVDLLLFFWSIFYPLNFEFVEISPNFEIKLKEPRKALKSCYEKLKTLFFNIEKGCKVVIFHYRTDTDEQKIAHKYWKRLFPFPFGTPSPSRYVLKKFLKENSDILQYKWSEVDGKVIFDNLDNALEVFMNFHFHGIFNRRLSIARRMIQELAEDLRPFQKNGHYVLSCGCSIIEVTRL